MQAAAQQPHPLHQEDCTPTETRTGLPSLLSSSPLLSTLSPTALLPAAPAAPAQKYANRVRIEYTVDRDAPEGWRHERGHISKEMIQVGVRMCCAHVCVGGRGGCMGVQVWVQVWVHGGPRVRSFPTGGRGKFCLVQLAASRQSASCPPLPQSLK